ncbi:hypothetical protein ACJIZ3_010373 [Penstemon smallii]|uniref:Uncharacterized protein n=1 Tax=Penstemon smallii TaxID=265156 RepID=A0ABD3TF54_9LAMI
MADNHEIEGSSAEEDEVSSPVGLAYIAAAAENSVDQKDPSSSTKGDVSQSFDNGPNDIKAAEDGVRDDMFVDCPDEIENSESQQNSEEKDNIQDDHLDESDSGIKVQRLMSEMELLRDSVAEKDRFAREYEEKVRELYSLLHTKDQEIDFLNAKVAELYELSQIAESKSSFKLDEAQLIDEVVSRTLAFLSITLHQEDSLDVSLAEKISNVEKSVTFLVEKYNNFLSETDQLKGCLTELGLDINTLDEVGTLTIARDRFLELRMKEDNLYQNLSHLEDENRKLLEEVEKQRSVVENANAEVGRLSTEVEQEKNRYVNTKEKLSMAVTKGKALVQQRDSLKQLLAEKTSQLEKCSIELQEKSSALEANEKLAASLQESLAEKDTILQKCDEILSEGVANQELQPTDITMKLRGLVDENISLQDISMQFHKLTDALSLFDFPETVAFSELENRVHWLVESLNLSKEEALKLQSEIDKTRETANGEIDHLTSSLLAESQEKNYLQAELEDLRRKYDVHERSQHELAEARETVKNEIDNLTKSLVEESQEKTYLQAELEDLRLKFEEIVQKEYHVSLEKDRIVSVLLEASGLTNECAEPSDTTTIIDQCIAKIKEKTSRVESSQIDVEIFESFQSLLYISDQEMRLYKLIIEEDALDRAETNRLSNDLESKTQELNTIKNEKDVMQKSHEQLEDRCVLLKDKLSMAVKKGKGLVQERENLKSALNEKNTEIDKLKIELQQSLSSYEGCQDKITKLSLEIEQNSQIQTDLISTKEHADQLAQFLAESNSMLQRIMESIEGITLPTDLTFDEPVQKVKWLAGYLSEHETAKIEVEQEMRNVKGEVISLASRLSEAQTEVKSLEDALSMAKNEISQLLDVNKELELSKALVEEELWKEKDIYTSKFEEVSLSKVALEEALSLAENDISRFMNERDMAEESRTLAEEQLQKLKEEFSNQVSKLADSDKTIRSLEDALSEAQKNESLLSEENKKVQTGSADLENEIKKIKEEADSHASKISEASLTIKSLEDALSNAENNVADLVFEKKNAEKEIVELRSKLKSCMEELDGTRGNIENRSFEISDQISRLRSILEDETLSSLVDQCFRTKIESLAKMDFLLKEIGDSFLEMDSNVLQNGSVVEDDSSISATLPFSPDTSVNTEMFNNEVTLIDDNSIMFHIERLNERFLLKDKILTDKFDNLSTRMDQSVAVLLRRLQMTNDRMISTIRYTKSLKQQVKDMETDNQRYEDTIVSLESDIKILSSACNDATQKLESNFHKMTSELRSIHELVKLEDKMFKDSDEVGAEGLGGDHMMTAEKLLRATRHNQELSELIHEEMNKLLSVTGETQKKMKEIELNFEEVSEERDRYIDKCSNLETEMDAQKNLCQEMMLKLDDFQKKEDNLRKREAELSTSSSEVHDSEDSPLSASQVKLILNKINEVEVPDVTFSAGEPSDSEDVRKLFFVIDSFNESLQKVNSLSHEKEELHSTIDKKILEIELLKEKIEEHRNNERDSEKMLTKLLDLELGLQNIVRKLGGNDLMDQKAANATLLLPLLEKLVIAIMVESENLKSKNEDLVTKLLESQKFVDDLSNNVKLLEDSDQMRIVPLETDLERGTSVASLSTQTEISEIHDMAASGSSSNIPLVPSAAHVRTMRKSSSDHLAINIDSESERLINNKEPDDDKGHVFKSLNTSGLIPKQGRTVADRVDGIWVSGSRALMSHPRGRLGLLAYWLVLHIWLLGTIL